MIPISDPKRQFAEIEDQILDELRKVLANGKYILGPNVAMLEKEICRKLGVTDAVGVANGTDALVLALESCGIGPGDEVITTPFTFFASSEAIVRVGAIPVFADVDKQTYQLDPAKIPDQITQHTKAILVVHLFGQTAEMDEIMAIAKQHRLKVIEDACQAFGAKYKGKEAGSIGDVGCFSFFPTKNLPTAGDGGLITTNNKKIADSIRSLRAHGSNRKYIHDAIGYNSRLDEMHAAILLQSLSRIDDWNNRRIELANRYSSALKDLTYIQLPKTAKDCHHIFHLYCIRSLQREKLMDHLEKSGITTGVYYPLCLHLQKSLKHLGYRKGDFPHAEKLSNQIFALPLFPGLTFTEQDIVIQALRTFAGDSSC